MNYLYLRSETRLKSYSATTAGTKSRVRIDLETDSPSQLSFLLEDLAAIVAEQKAQAQRAKEAAAAAKRKKPLALPAPLLGLPYYPEGE